MKTNPDEVFILLSVGANLGSRRSSIREAHKLLQYSGIIHDSKLSSFFETEPVGVTNQPMFINAAISGYTSLPVNYLIEFVKSIEYLLGRKIREKWFSREIDIDIILYGDSIVEQKKITIPHPEMHKRKFVLFPASEIASWLTHPILNKSISQLLNDCDDKSEVNKL